MSQQPRTASIELTKRQLTLVRVAVLFRLTNLQTQVKRMEGQQKMSEDEQKRYALLKASYDDTLAMMENDGVLYKAMRSVTNGPKDVTP